MEVAGIWSTAAAAVCDAYILECSTQGGRGGLKYHPVSEDRPQVWDPSERPYNALAAASICKTEPKDQRLVSMSFCFSNTKIKIK